MDNNILSEDSIYEVLYEEQYKSKDGHKLYHVKCKRCGYEITLRKIDAERTRICRHIAKIGDYVYYVSDRENIVNKRLRNIYNGIIARCYNIDSKAYVWYGAKGIKVCDEWIKCPSLFEKWSYANNYSDTLTIDRIDPDKDYCPENCRWITLEDNSKWKSTTNYIEVDGELHTGKEWARILNLGPNIINTYIREYDYDIAIEFIRKRKHDMTKARPQGKTWLDVYEIDTSSCCKIDNRKFNGLRNRKILCVYDEFGNEHIYDSRKEAVSDMNMSERNMYGAMTNKEKIYDNSIPLHFCKDYLISEEPLSKDDVEFAYNRRKSYRKRKKS